jgi:hypothetical protein
MTVEVEARVAEAVAARRKVIAELVRQGSTASSTRRSSGSPP